MVSSRKGAVVSRLASFLVLGLALLPPSVAARSAPVSVSRVAHDSLPEAISSALSLYRSPPDSSEVAELLAELGPDPLSTRAGPTRFRLALARLWTRAGEPVLALEMLAPTEVAEVEPGPLAELERARALFALASVHDAAARPEEWEGRQGPQPVPTPAGAMARHQGERAFWDACEVMDPRVKRQLWLDLRVLMTPDEQAEWRDLSPEPSACGWIREFVAERAWRSGLSAAERLQVHYRRLAHAREWYWLRNPRLQTGMADGLGRPDSLEVDDRGLLYARMGPPERVVALPGNQTWAYYGSGQPRLYHLAPATRAGYLGTFEYYLLESLGEEGGSAVSTAHRVLHEPPERAGLFPLGEFRGLPVLPGLRSRRRQDGLARLYATRSALDARYGTVAFLMQVHGRGGLRVAKLLSELEADNRAAARTALQTIPDIPLLERDVRFASEVVRFRNPGEQRGEIWVLGTARAGDVEVESEKSDADREEEADDPGYAFTARLSWLAGHDVRTAQLPVDLSPDQGLGEEDGLFFGLRLALAPGSYPYTLAVRTATDEQGRAGGNWARDTLAVSASTPELPALSDIAVASDSGGSWTRDGRTFLRFSPAHVTGADGALHVYFEAYGIEPGGEYQVEVRLVDEGEAGEMWEADPGDLAFRLSFESEMPRREHPTGRHHLRLDLADTEPGAYVLGVRVREVATGTESLPVTTPVRVRAHD